MIKGAERYYKMDDLISNSIFVDPFGYMWMLYKIYKNLSYEERIKRQLF